MKYTKEQELMPFSIFNVLKYHLSLHELVGKMVNTFFFKLWDTNCNITIKKSMEKIIHRKFFPPIYKA